MYSCDCVDKAAEEFTKLIFTILDREDMAPIKTFQQRNNYAAWLTDGNNAKQRPCSRKSKTNKRS